MKKFAASFAAITFMADAVSARRRLNHLEGHFDYQGTARAICAINVSPNDPSKPSGWTKLTEQRLEDGTLGATLIESYWGHLKVGENYTL